MEIQAARRKFMTARPENGLALFYLLNDRLTEEGLRSQLSDFRDKGIYGVVLHPRVGMTRDMPYLSRAFLDRMRFIVREAGRFGMQVYLYDEASYPSGSGHGLVVEGHPEFRARGVRLKACPAEQAAQVMEEMARAKEFIGVVGLFSAALDEKGRIRSLRRQADGQALRAAGGTALILEEAYTGGVIRGLHPDEDDASPNAPPYADILNPEANARYLQVVHEVWYQALKEYFGGTIRAMFTDEPHFGGKRTARDFRAWTPGFETYLAEHGMEFEALPLLWLDGLDGREAEVRRRFDEIVAQRLRESYFEPMADWCAARGIALTGHPMKADDIGSLAAFQIPCQDVVWRWVEPNNANALTGPESTQAKCTSDSARHRGKPLNANECFGAFGWNLRMDEIKWVFDWLFVRGVNLLFMSSTYYSVRAERALDRPPDTTRNNLWWHQFPRVSEYAARMCGLLRATHNTAQIAVLCDRDRVSSRVARELFVRQIEFNYLERDLLGECRLEDGALNIGSQRYTALIVPEDCSLAGCEGLLEGGFPVVEEARADWAALEPTVRLEPAGEGIRVSRLSDGERVYYLLTNEGEAGYSGRIWLKEGTGCEAWDFWRAGAESLFPDERGALCLNLGRRESRVLVPDRNPAAPGQSKAVREHKQPVDQGWHVASLFQKDRIPGLGKWNEIPGMRNFSGNLLYENQIALPEVQEGERVLLDLGEVHDWAEVYVDYQLADVLFWPPYAADITAFADGKRHHVCVSVFNSLANHYEDANLDSGLCGPVSLVRESRTEARQE